MKSVTPIYKRKCVYLIENVQGLLKYDIFYDVCLYCLTTCGFIIILQNGGDEVVQTLHGLENGLDYAETIYTISNCKFNLCCNIWLSIYSTLCLTCGNGNVGRLCVLFINFTFINIAW